MSPVQRRRLCVFCGSSVGKGEKYISLARDLGRFMVENHLDLVYGGAGIGLMGELANEVRSAHGTVYGVIPQFMVEVELAHKNLTQLFIVDSMHERKYRMYELADVFLALPGGIGTLDELMEILTWAQLDRHQKVCGLLNYDRYFDLLLGQMDHMVEEGFLRKNDRHRLQVFNQVADLKALF